jgi:hypothetical protein
MGYIYICQGMTVRICGIHNLQFCICKRKFKGTVPRDLLLVCTMYNFVCAKGSLKGQCHEIYDFKFFMNQFLPSPEYPIGAI